MSRGVYYVRGLVEGSKRVEIYRTANDGQRKAARAAGFRPRGVGVIRVMLRELKFAPVCYIRGLAPGSSDPRTAEVFPVDSYGTGTREIWPV